MTPADLKTDSFVGPQPFAGTVTSVPSGSTATANEAGTPNLAFTPVTSRGPVTSMPAAPKNESAVAATPAPGPATPSVAANQPVQSSETSAAPAATAGAKVLTVNRKFNFVVVNQGLQEGLKMGDKLKVFKQGQEVATVQIEKLYDRFSAATLVEEDPKQQVVEGDEIRKV